MAEHENDPDDPWTYFGQFSKAEIDGASRLLADAKIVFEVREGEWEPGDGWSGPFELWVRDESADNAASLLVPFFASREGSG